MTLEPTQKAVPSGSPASAEPSREVVSAASSGRGGRSGHVTGGARWELLWSGLGLGVWAAVMGSLIFVQTRSYFPVPPLPPELAAQIQPFQPIPPEANEAVNALEQQTAYRNMALSFGLFGLGVFPVWGAIVGLFLGRGHFRGLVCGILLALPAGLIAGVAGVWLKGQFSVSAAEGDPTLRLSALQACCWILFSLGLTLVAVMQTREWRLFPALCLVTTLAAILGTISFQVLAMLLTPMALPDLILPDTAVGNALFAGLGVTLPVLAAINTLCPRTSRPAVA